MKHFFKAVIYFILTSITLWLLCVLFSLLVSFSYTDYILSWIPFILLGGWVPGKLYGLNLFHSILCVAICFGIIGFFDKKFELGDNTRKTLLLLTVALFLNETILNFFLRGSQPMETDQSRQFALLQLSFIIGILIKTFNKDAKLN